MRKFNLGHKFNYKGFPTEITDAEWEDAINDYVYRINLPHGGYMWVAESVITNPKCDCGAKFDRDFPDVHMQMCATNKLKV